MNDPETVTPAEPADSREPIESEPAESEPAESASTESTEPVAIREMVLESLGGWRGFIDAGLPSLAFIIANAVSGLNAAIWAGVIAGAVVFVVRLLTRGGLQQAFSGLFALAICVFIAKQTGEARDFFVFGIIRSGAVALVLFATVLVRRPLAGYAWNFFSPIQGKWRSQKYLVRVFGWLTAAWGAAFLARFLVEGALYLADNTSGLGAVRIALGYPVTFVLLALTYLVASKATGQTRRIRLPGRRKH